MAADLALPIGQVRAALDYYGGFSAEIDAEIAENERAADEAFRSVEHEAAAGVVTDRLLLDEHYGQAIAEAMRERGHDVIAVVADPELRGRSDADIYAWAAARDYRIVTENIKDFRPLLIAATARGGDVAGLLLVHPRRYPRGGAQRASAIIEALDGWLRTSPAAPCPIEDWLA